ncbi:hypothetical protein GZL_05521 [Streptomyces sp. 769]|nr:hypothetical protein GZL_05521 [Streptomyces sp. 769]
MRAALRAGLRELRPSGGGGGGGCGGAARRDLGGRVRGARRVSGHRASVRAVRPLHPCPEAGIPYTVRPTPRVRPAPATTPRRTTAHPGQPTHRCHPW